jgi:hypothetical protein
VACVGEIQVNVNRYPNHIFLDQKGVEYSIALRERERGCSAGIFWLISACLGLFSLTKYYSFYQPSTIHSASRTPS